MIMTSVKTVYLTQQFQLLLNWRRSVNREQFIKGEGRLHNLKRKMLATEPRGKCFRRMRGKGLI